MTDDSIVIVTRPPAQAESFAARVAQSGRRVVIFPLLDILPLQDVSPLKKALAALPSYALAAFVSPNAIDAAFAIINAWPAGVPIAVMGEGSRQALARHGVTSANATIFSPQDTDRTDSETLLKSLDLDSFAGRRVLILRGQNGRELLADALREKGVDVDQVAAYRREAPLLDDARRAQLRDLLSGQADWVITSSEALRNLRDMARDVEGEGGVVKLQQQTIVCPHVRIKLSAESLGFTRIVLTASGDDRLLVALQSRA